MSDQVRDNEPSSGNPSPPEVGCVNDSDACKMQGKGCLKRILPMTVCCAAPLLVLAAIPLLGLTFGSLAGVTNGLLSVVALLACPVSMFFMMRMMTKDK